MTMFAADTDSIDNSAHLLIEIAALLHEGRLDADIGTMARAPRSHQEVGRRVQQFAHFADDQYQDLVLLVTALATKLRTTGQDYVRADGAAAARLDQILGSGQYVAPADR